MLSGPLSVTGNPSWVLEVVPNLPQMSHISISFPRPTRAFHTTHGKGCGWGVPFPLVEQRRSHSGALMAPKQPPMMFKLPSVTRLWEDLDPDLSFSHHMGMILIFFLNALDNMKTMNSLQSCTNPDSGLGSASELSTLAATGVVNI